VSEILFIDSGAITRSGGGSISSSVYFKMGDRYFPGKGWNDFVVIILGWWIKSIMDISKSSDGTAGFLLHPSLSYP